jgi:hypothetical protein
MWLRRCSTHAGAAFNALAQKRFGTGHERFAEPLTLSKLSVLREAWTTTLQERKPLPVGEVLLWLSKTDTIDADVTGDGVNADRALETIEALEAASSSKIEWGERGASLIIRLLADANRIHDATVRLDALKAPKRRSVTPILEACARTDDGATAHRLWQFATDTCKLRMTEAELCPVLWTQRRDPRRVHELLTEHAACGDNGVLSPDAAESVSSTLIAAGALVEEASIDEATGKCDQCGAVLQPQEISIEDRDALLRGIAESIPKPQRATFAIFERYMESCVRNVEWCPTVVLDGANIGYFAVPSSSGGPPRMGMDYLLLDEVMRQCRAAGKRPLLLLHQRHIESKNVPAAHRSVVEGWQRSRELFGTPRGVYDDVYWLYASLFLSRSGRRVNVVTGDLMRDHVKGLDARAFRKWRDVHMERFVCVRDHKRDQTDVSLLPPPLFSTALQFQLDAARPGGVCWHLPIVMPHERPVVADETDEPRVAGMKAGPPHEAQPVTAVWLCARLALPAVP